MTSAFRLLAALFSVVFMTTFFLPAHRLLPAKVRLLSFGFISIAVMFYGAGILRHCLVAGHPFETFAVGHAIYLVFLLVLFGHRFPAALLLYMAASSGVDLVVAAAVPYGDIDGPAVRSAALVWEFAAAAVAIIRMQASRQSAAS